MRYFFTLLAVLLVRTEGHGYLNQPKSRNLKARDDGLNYCPHCWNAGTVAAVKANDPDGWEYPETVSSSSRHGLCGDEAGVEQRLMLGGDLYGGGQIQETYIQGQTITISVWVSTHHHGWFEFFLCDKGDLADSSGPITQECLLKHQLMRSTSDPTESPIHPDYPGRYFMYPKCHDTLQSDGQGLLYMDYVLPADVSCTHCVLQWWWVTANSCHGGGYDRPEIFPDTYQDCSGDGGAQGWLPNPSFRQCTGDYAYPEEFWNCADIAILPSDSPTPPTTPVTSPVPSPVSVPVAPPAPAPVSAPVSSPAPAPVSPPTDTGCAATWESCGGDSYATRNCCASRDECIYVNQWYHQCQPSNSAPTPSGCNDLGTAPPVDSSGFAQANGKLKLGGTNGIQLVNANGVPVQLTGMSSHGVHWFYNCYSFSAIEYLVKNWGITVFRAAMYIGEGGYATDKSHLDIVKDIVDWCETLGIYVIIDWHVLTPGDPNYWLTGAGASQASAETFWRDIATQYKDKDHVLYEIANEPNGVQWNDVKIYSDSIISTIRAVDPESVIIVGTTTWSQDIHLAYETPVANPYNVMYAFHFYSGTHEFLYSRVQELADKLPIFASEWGTSEASGNNGPFLEVAQKFLDLFKEKKISWAQWSYADKSETSAALKPGACDAKAFDDTSCSGTFLKNYIKLNTAAGGSSSPTIQGTEPPAPLPTPLQTQSPTNEPPTSPPTPPPTPLPPSAQPTPPPTPPPSSPTSSSQCAALYEKCGGNGHNGPTCCKEGTLCIFGNPWYSQCQPDPNRQCGIAYDSCSGSKRCCEGTTCVAHNPYYSSCVAN